MGRDDATSARPLIAVIEDDFAVRNSVAFALQSEGYSVRTYECAEDVLKDLLVKETDCFIIDEKLPGLNGLNLLHELRRRNITAPAVIITTAPNAGVRKGAAAACAVIVEKPLLGEALFVQIRAALAPGPART